MPRVTVRLGMLTRAEGRYQQKGVDAAMHAQLAELARNHACSDIVLITGDGDLLPGVMAAKDHGVAIHVWAVQAADGEYNQSEDLVAEADERHLLDREWLTQAIIKAALPSAEAQDPAQDAPAPLPLGHAVPVDEPEHHPLEPPRIPTPRALAQRPTPEGATLRWSSDAGWVEPDAEFPRLHDLTTPEQEWADREHDLTVTGEPREVGSTFAIRWTERLPDDQAAQLINGLAEANPRIPRSLDGELLRYAARFGMIADGLEISEADRVHLRAGFWDGIALSASETAAAH
jgi:hypothetical protein